MKKFFNAAAVVVRALAASGVAFNQVLMEESETLVGFLGDAKKDFLASDLPKAAKEFEASNKACSKALTATIVGALTGDPANKVSVPKMAKGDTKKVGTEKNGTWSNPALKS